MGKLCELCSKAIRGNRFEKIENFTVEMLDALFIKPNIDITKQPVLCKKCMRNIRKGFEFKCMCLNTEEFIAPLVKSQKALDIKEAFLKHNGNLKATDISEIQICRLCLKLADAGYFQVPVNKNLDTVIDTMQIYLPELDLTAVKEPLFCTTCLDSHKSFVNFKQNLELSGRNEQESEARIATNVERESSESEEDLDEGTEHEQAESILKSNDMGFRIKREEIHIKSEYGDCEGDGSGCTSKRRGTRRATRRKRCEHCGYCGPLRYMLEVHALKHMTASQVDLHKCDKCPFKTKYRLNLKHHETTHATVMLRCDRCKFRCKRKSPFQKHVLGHEKPKEIFKCNHCDFKTIYKSGHEYHSLNHKSASEVMIMRCDACEYKTRHRCLLRSHMVVHRIYKEDNRIQCEVCEYTAKTRQCMRRHMVTHKDLSDVTMYRCKVCAYQTKYKNGLKRHAVVHLSPSETTIYPCDLCTFESKHKEAVRAHRRTHTKKSVEK